MGSKNENRRFEQNRAFLKDSVRQKIDFTQTAQIRRLPPPAMQKPYAEDSICIDLPAGVEALTEVCAMPLNTAILQRQSTRDYSEESLSLLELSALLYAAQGVREVVGANTALRTVPSAGARHAFETYIVVNRVEGLSCGLYRYLPFENKLLQLKIDAQIHKTAASACLGQMFVAKSAVTFFWTVTPERMEWRYDLAAHKVLAIDAGHVCQNLYLAATAINAGVCAIAAYDQEACDHMLGVDGDDEYTVYLAPVGKCLPKKA